MKAIWFALGFALALVIVGALALVPLLSTRAKAEVEPLPTALPWPTAPADPTATQPARPTTAPQASPTAPPTAVPPQSLSGLTWQRVASLDGRCDRLEIDGNHAAHYAPCDQGTRLAYLTQEELTAYLDAITRWAPFQYTVQGEAALGSALGSATVSLTVRGHGQGQATAAEQAELAAWAARVYERVYEEERRADLVALARLDLAGRQETTVESIVVVSAEAMTWPDACLGVAVDGLFCAQVETPGYRILLRAADGAGSDGVYEYRTDRYGLVKRAAAP